MPKYDLGTRVELPVFGTGTVVEDEGDRLEVICDKDGKAVNTVKRSVTIIKEENPEPFIALAKAVALQRRLCRSLMHSEVSAQQDNNLLQIQLDEAVGMIYESRREKPTGFFDPVMRDIHRRAEARMNAENECFLEEEGMVHVLVAGRAICGKEGVPAEWDFGEYWVRKENADQATCPKCIAKVNVSKMADALGAELKGEVPAKGGYFGALETARAVEEIDCMGATCPDCGEPHQIVRPGKTEPTCSCDRICFQCGDEIKYHSSPDPRWPKFSGYFCETCGPIGYQDEEETS